MRSDLIINLMKLNQILRSRSGSQEKRGPVNDDKTIQNPLTLQKKTLSGVVAANESMSRASSFSQAQQKTANQFKISKLNNDALIAAYRNITKNFAAEIDFYFKNYNKFIKESMNKIDVQVKASKKEKVRHQQFLAREELLYWSDFPRSRPFYHEDLLKIKQICTGAINKNRDKNGITPPNEIRDFDFIVQVVLDSLPENSRKYCQRFQINWEMVQPVSQDSTTFEELTQNLSMFDSDSARNWQILGHTVNLMAADVLAILLDQTEQEQGIGGVAPVHLSLDVSHRILRKCKNLAQPVAEHSLDLDSITMIDSLYEQTQYVWSNKIYEGISKLSSQHFDACLKLIQSPLQSDHRKLSAAEVELVTHQIYFGRYLAIAPQDLEMGAKVLSLLDTFLQFMLQKSITEEFKQSLLATLKYLVEKLCFYSDTRNADKGRFDVKAMQIQWERVTKIYQAAEKLTKKEGFREQAHLLMAQILKIASEDFVDQNLLHFKDSIRMNQLFQSRSTYSADLRVVCTLYVNKFSPQKYKQWWPQTEQKKNLLWGNDGEKIVTPICFKTVPLNHVQLARKPYMIGSVSDTFQMIFNPKILSTLAIEHSHWTFLEQASFDDLEFVCKQGLTMLLDQRFADKGTHILNIGLKLAKFILDPASCFQEKYIEVHGGPYSIKSKNLPNCLAQVNKLLCEAIKDICSLKLNLRTDFMKNCLHFFKREEAKNLCSDQTSVIWTQLDEELIFKQTYAISRDLKSQGLAKFHLQDKPRTITFEDLNEIDMLAYENPFFNKLVKELGKNVGQLWDRKKEMFIRHRLECFFGEAEEGQFIGKQNTSIYSEVPHQRQQALKMLRRIISCLHFLPEMQEFFTAFPTHNLLIERKSMLAARGPYIKLPGKESPESSPEVQETQGDQLGEAVNLLPYLTLGLDFKIVEKTMKFLCHVMITGTIKTKLAMLDQIIYIVKELALSSPEHHLIPQLLNLLLTMVRVWHHSEKFKMLLNGKHFKVGEYLGQTQYKVIKMNFCAPNSDIVSENAKQLQKHLLQFDLLDMVSFLGLANKDLNVRQISLMLTVETGKLKRLLFHKDSAKNGLSDVLTNTRDLVKTQIVEKLAVFYCFKGYGHKDWGYFYELLSDKDFYHFAVDNFEYAKAGLWESLVRDIQIVFFGEIAQLWKSDLQGTSEVADQIFKFMWKLTSRCSSNYESIAGRGSQEAAKSGALQQLQKRDHVGFNLLLALVIQNVFAYPQSQPFPGRPTNSILDDMGSLFALSDSNFNQMHKIPFGKFYPSRMWTSNILLTFLYYLQNESSLDTLAEIFQIKLQSSEYFVQNCLLFNSLLSIGGNDNFTGYLLKQVLKEESQGIQVSSHFKAWVSMYLQIEEVELQDDDLGKKKTLLKVVMANGICTALRKLRDETNNLVISTDYLPIKLQLRILSETRANYNSILKSNEIQWLAPKIKQIWFSLLTFEEEALLNDPKAKLDLKFLIQLEKEGFTGSLKYYKYFSKADADGKAGTKSEANKVGEIKLLIQHVYSCNDKGTAIKQNLSNTINSIADQSQILSAANVSAISLADQIQSKVNYQKNVYFKCLATCLFDTNVLQQELMDLVEKKSFDAIYTQVCNSIFPTSSKLNLQTRLKKLSGYNLHAKIFLVSLFVSLNAVDHSFVEKARVLALSILPLMFGEKKYREEVEQKICDIPNIKLLINFENKQFYQFIKRVFREEETFNMQHHFEKFFSLSGFLRDLLNEIIKLQSNDADGEPLVGPKHLLRVLDIVTYFFSGHLDLRRAPKVQAEDQQESFIFANLIDYKSFEFLSKLYKISEKLSDHDGDMLVMNMWYKVVEGRPHNFEILAKFLIHNLSSFIMKLKASVDTSENQPDEVSYGIEYEKHKRFSLSIFNYIKARTQQLDMRNSLNVSSVTWSQKMLKIVLRAQMNLQSKYSLEKMKLKKVLQMLHAEINQSGLRLQLKGGLETLNQLMAVGDDTMMDSIRSSVSMSQLLESKTFLNTFGGHNKQEASTVKQLVFIIARQMSEKFEELTPDSQIDQLPDLIIKYFENTLILIANEAERLQIVKYTLKEELTVTILVLLLVSDLATQTKSDVNRYYFMYDLINKLAMSIAGIQKYLKLNSLSMEQFMAIQSVEDLLNIFNYRNTQEIFGLFTKLYFKVLVNVTCMPDVHSHMLQLWLMTLRKHMQVKELEIMKAPFYSRDQNLVMLKGCFFTLHQISMKTKHGSIGIKDQQKVRKLFGNFHEQIDCVLEYIHPKGNRVQMKQFTDHYAQEISFATNAAFWLSYACLEMAIVAEETNKQVVQLQTTGMRAMRRILEESDFLKLLIGINKLSPHFYRYSLSLPQQKTSLLDLLFETLMNPEACEDAFKSLIVTIRILDQQLLSSGSDENEVGRDELNRLLLLLPFFLQQFIVSEEGTVRQSTALLFSNKRNIVQLLKKSLPSIGIDKKKEVLSILDVIQREADHNDKELIKEQFILLAKAVVDSCLALNHQQVITRSLRILRTMMYNAEDSSNSPVVESHIFKTFFDIIQEQMQASGTQDLKVVDPFTALKEEFYSVNELLGEEVCQVSKDLRPLYFGLKNIILKEIEYIDKEIDVQRFFVQEDSAIPIRSASGLSGSSISPYMSLLKKNSVTSTPGVGSSSHRASLPGSGRASITKQPTTNSESDNAMPSNFIIKPTPANLMTNKQEMAAKYMNSQNVIAQTPSTILKSQSVIETGSDNHAYLMSSANNTTRKSFKAQQSPMTGNNISSVDENSQEQQSDLNNVIHEIEEHAEFSPPNVIKQRKQELSQILFEDDDSNEQAQVSAVDKALEGVKNAANSFAENVMKEESKLKLNRTEIIDDSPREVEGLIGTFAKPQTQSPVPNLRIKQKQLEKEIPLVQKKKSPPKHLMRGEVGTADLDLSQQISSISVKHSALRPNFVAEKTGQLYSEMDKDEANMEQMRLERPNTGHFSQMNAKDFGFSTESNLRIPKHLQEQPPASEHHAKTLPKQAARVANFVKEDQSALLSSQHLSMIDIVNDEDRFFDLEQFFDEKSYDVDNFIFYVKVIEFRQERVQNNANLAAGLIIDNYLAEDAEYYIGGNIKSDKVITDIIKSYERFMFNQQPVEKHIFDEAVKCLSTDLEPLLQEFNQRSDSNQ